MFAYFTKINGNDIITYTHDMIRLYYNEDDYNDDEYLFNTQSIANWVNEYNVKLVSFIPPDEIVSNGSNGSNGSNYNIIPLFSYS